MAAADTQKLDKNTPDATWREVLGTAEVGAHANSAELHLFNLQSY